MQDSTFLPGLCRIKYHQFQSIISWCSILLRSFKSKRARSGIVLGRAPLVAAFLKALHSSFTITASICRFDMPFNFVVMSHTRHCNQCSRHYHRANEWVSPLFLPAVWLLWAKGCPGCFIILAWAHLDVYWYQTLFISKTWPSLSSTLSLCNSKLPSKFLCLYLFVVWACERDSNFRTNSNCYPSSTQHRRPPFYLGSPIEQH